MLLIVDLALVLIFFVVTTSILFGLLRLCLTIRVSITHHDHVFLLLSSSDLPTFMLLGKLLNLLHGLVSIETLDILDPLLCFLLEFY